MAANVTDSAVVDSCLDKTEVEPFFVRASEISFSSVTSDLEDVKRFLYS